MGSCTSKQRNEINDLKEQVQSLMQKDVRMVQKETISKEEFNELKEQFKRLEEDLEKKISVKYTKLILDKDIQINDLAKQIESLKSINSGLELKMKTMLLSSEIHENTDKLSQLSKAKVDEFVEKLLNDADVNIKYLPDFVERAIYKNVLNLIMALLNNVFDTVSVKFLGHNLTFTVMPDNQDHQDSQDNQDNQNNNKELDNFLYGNQFKIDTQELDTILN